MYRGGGSTRRAKHGDGEDKVVGIGVCAGGNGNIARALYSSSLIRVSSWMGTPDGS